MHSLVCVRACTGTQTNQKDNVMFSYLAIQRDTQTMCVWVCMCACVYVPACYSVQSETLINTLHPGKWWFKWVLAFVNTGSAPQIEMQVNEDLCDWFPPDGGYNGSGVGPGRFPQMTNHSRICGAIKILLPHHSSSSSSSANSSNAASWCR